MEPNEYDHIQLPPTQGAGNEPIGERIGTFLNAFVVRTEKCVPTGYVHQLVFTAVTADNEVAIHEAGGDEEPQTICRQMVLKYLLEKVLEEYPAHFANKGAAKSAKALGFSGGSALYTPYKMEPLQGVLACKVLPELKMLVPGTTLIKFVLTSSGQISLAGQDIAEPKALRLVETLVWRQLNGTAHTKYGNCAYYTSWRSSPEQIEGGRVIKKGIAARIRPIGDLLVIQFDGLVTPFFDTDCLANVCSLFHWEYRELEEQLRGLIFTPKLIPEVDLPVACFYKIERFALTIADEERRELRFADGPAINVSLTEFMRRRYGYTLRHPDRRLVEVRREDGQIELLPAELLEIAGGQRVRPAQLTSVMKKYQDLSEEMDPTQLFELIHEHRMKAFLLDDGESHEALHEFQLKISMQQMTSTADILFPPLIRTGDGNGGLADKSFGEQLSESPNFDYQFVRPAHLPERELWMIIFDDCVEDGKSWGALSALQDACRKRGMGSHTIDVEKMSSRDIDRLLRLMQQRKQKNAAAIIAVSHTDTDRLHRKLKLFEAETGVVTLNLNLYDMDQLMENNGELRCEQLVLKLNQKIGGVNFSLAPSPDLAIYSPILNKRSESWFSCKRMYMGIYASPARPHSSADRAAGILQSEPTVIGIAYTTTEMTKQEGFYFLQRPGSLLIQNMEEYILDAIRNFSSATGDRPDEIVVYRSGESEDDFKALSTEITQFTRAFTKVERSTYSPSITIIVVCPDSHYRIVLEGKENVSAGTCLTTHGCSPFLKEFVLVADEPRQGISRPIRYTVVHEQGNEHTIDELKLITNTLAYGETTKLAPISVPAPFHSARQLAKRGRNNYETKLRMAKDASPTPSELPREFRSDGTQQFFETLSAQLKPKTTGHYWA